MPLSVKQINNAEDYKDLVEKFSFLVEKEFEKVEKFKESDAFGLVEAVPKLISLVNTIGYLRGQDGAFIEARPNLYDYDPDLQKDLYKNEDAFEARLSKLIDFVKSSEAKWYYKERLETYFLKARGAIKPLAGSKQKTAWGYNVPGDFDKGLIYQLPDFDFSYIGEKTVIWGPFIQHEPIYHTPITVLYFLITPRDQSMGTQKFLGWSAGTGIVSPGRFTLGEKKFVLDFWKGITIWENEKFQKDALDIKLSDRYPF